jgi:hypothetical protein
LLFGRGLDECETVIHGRHWGGGRRAWLVGVVGADMMFAECELAEAESVGSVVLVLSVAIAGL